MEHADQPNTDTNDSGAPPPPDFTALFPNVPTRMMVELAYNAHVNYSAAHATRYGVESVGFKAWKATLSDFTSTIYGDTDDDCEQYDTALQALVTVEDMGRHSNNGAEVAYVINWATNLLSDAKANLQAIYMGTKRADAQLPDGADPVAMRDELDSLLAACAAMADTPLLDRDVFWSIFPTTTRKSKSGSTRIVYDGPKIPQTRTSQPVRANAQLTLNLIEADGSTLALDGKFGENVKEYLRLDMAELRTVLGTDGTDESDGKSVFREENYGAQFVSPNNGRKFSISRPTND